MRLAEHQRWPFGRLLGIFAVIIAVVLLVIGLITPSNAQLGVVGGDQGPLTTVLALALPTFLAGVFSFLSPCTLPILPAYFAFTFQAKRQQVALMTLAFFLGLATTMTLLGATLSVLGRAVYNLRETLMFWGGLLIIGLGILNALGKGFSGVQIQRRPSATFAGTYLFGMTFALGWSACTGPILGALFTLMLAQGVTVLAGGLLALIYALGLAVPLLLIAVFFKQLGAGSRAWTILRGRAWSFELLGRAFHLHSTSVLSGLLLIVVGYLLASGQLFVLSQWAASTRAGAWAVAIETWISDVFRVGR